MKRLYLLFTFLLFILSSEAQTPCQLSLDSIYIDTALSNCNHLFFKYKISGGSATSYHWNYGDGNTCTCIKPKNFYTKNGSFQVCGRIQDANACADSMCITVNINCSNPCDLSGIGIYSVDSLSYSCKEYEFITITSPNAKKIHWDFGDGDSSDTKYTLHTFRKNGNYKVRIIIRDSIACADTSELNVQVFCIDSFLCHFKLHSIDTSSGNSCKTKLFHLNADAHLRSVRWDFGDGKNEMGMSDMQHIFADTGYYQVCAYGKDSFQCLDTVCQWVHVKCPDLSNLNGIHLEVFTISPNPFLTELLIESPQSLECKIYDVYMKEILLSKLEPGLNRLELGFVKPGIYFISLKLEGKTSYFRILKQ